MKKLFFTSIFILSLVTIHAQTTKTAPAPAVQWAMRPNYDLKGDAGLLTITLPSQGALSFTVSRAGETKALYTWRNSTSRELPPGSYDVMFWNIKIPNVVVEKGKETRILAGVLNSTVKRPWEVWTSDSIKVFAAGGAKMVALPPGKYVVKTGGAEIKTTITDGQTSIFSFTAY